MSTSEENFNPYRVLNLHEDASQKEVKSRFFSLSRAFHPDKQPAELFRESSQQFEKVEEAYKILSTPMRKYVFDKYGVAGIKVCNDKIGKLENLEEEFKEASLKYEHAQEAEDGDDLRRLDAEAELKVLKEKVRNNVEYLHRRLEEEHLCQTFVKEISVSQVIDLEDMVNHYVRRIPQSKQARARGLIPYVGFGGLFMNHWILLPEYKGVQHLFGVYGNQNPAKNDTNYGFKYRFRKILPKLKNTEIVGLFTLGDVAKEANINLEKNFDNGMHVTLSTRLVEGSVSAIINRRFRDDMSWYSQGQYDGEGDLLTGISKEFKNLGMKLDCGIQTSSDKIRITETLTKQITKKLTAFSSVNTFFTPAPITQVTLGFTYKLSTISKFSFSSSFIGKSFNWEIRYTRLGFKLRLPINLGNRCDRDVLLFSLGVTGAIFYCTYLYDKFRKRTKNHLKKLERKHRSRLMDGRRALNATVGEIHSEVANKVANEASRKGIVILKAYYGYGPYVNALYAKELKKWGYTRCFKPNRPINNLLEEEVQEAEALFNGEPNELIDIRTILQQGVVNSQLEFTLESLNAVRGVYNPCLDDNCQPYLLLVVHMNEKIFIKLLKKKNDKISLNSDYDKYMSEAEVESRYSLKAWLSTIAG